LIASFIVVGGMILMCIAGAVIFGWRGLHYGFRLKRVEVRGKVCEGRKA
jgi:hypothetical protein